MKRIALGLIGLLGAGCVDTLAPGQSDIAEHTEMRRAARRRDTTCDEADSGSSVDALVYVNSGYDANRRDANTGYESDSASYDLSGEEVPLESSEPICERVNFSLNRIDPNDGITFISHIDTEGNVIYRDSVNWSDTNQVVGIAGGDKETCYTTFELPRGYTVFSITPDFCRCVEGSGPETACPISPTYPDQLQCGSGIYNSE